MKKLLFLVVPCIVAFVLVKADGYGNKGGSGYGYGGNGGYYGGSGAGYGTGYGGGGYQSYGKGGGNGVYGNGQALVYNYVKRVPGRAVFYPYPVRGAPARRSILGPIIREINRDNRRAFLSNLIAWLLPLLILSNVTGALAR